MLIGMDGRYLALRSRFSKDPIVLRHELVGGNPSSYGFTFFGGHLLPSEYRNTLRINYLRKRHKVLRPKKIAGLRIAKTPQSLSEILFIAKYVDHLGMNTAAFKLCWQTLYPPNRFHYPLLNRYLNVPAARDCGYVPELLVQPYGTTR